MQPIRTIVAAGTAAATRATLVAVMLAALVVAPKDAQASACCMSAATTGVGRLKSWETVAIGSTLTWRHGIGAWSGDGDYDGLGEALADDLVATLWGLVRVHPQGSVWLRVPTQLGLRGGQGSAGTLRTNAIGVGDLDVGLRWAWIEVGDGNPAVASSLGVTTPTGRAPVDSRDPLAADVSGRGAWAISFVTTVERTHMPWFLRGSLGAAVSLPAWRADAEVWQRFGPSVTASLAAGRQLRSGLVASAMVTGTWEAALRRDGVAVPKSSALLTTATLALSWQIGEAWTLQAAAGASPPAAGFGRNRDAQVTTTLGLRYGVIP